MKRVIVLFLFLLVLSGCSQPNQPEANIAEKIATNLGAPWSIAKTDDTFFISERGGNIVKITANGVTVKEDVELSAPLSTAAEAGLMGLVLTNDFFESKTAYAYYTYDKAGTPVNRIVELQYSGTAWIETSILLDNIESGPVHHGGRLAISPNGQLFATIGDAADSSRAQDETSFSGKIITLNEDGAFDIFSTGHRNPQGLAWDANGVMYASEHGQSANDEINIIEEGNNYGWPVIEGAETKVEMETPLLTSGSSETWAPSGMTFHKGLLYVAALRGQAILVIDSTNGKLLNKIEGFGRVRDVFSDGDFLYFITNNTDGRGDPAEDDDVFYRMTVE